jgi:hypothetical protein
MKKSELNIEHLSVESFDTVPNLVSIPGAGLGTACFETCKTDPTSDPDAETCGPA